jgi:hypothetical protein
VSDLCRWTKFVQSCGVAPGACIRIVKMSSLQLPMGTGLYSHVGILLQDVNVGNHVTLYFGGGMGWGPLVSVLQLGQIGNGRNISSRTCGACSNGGVVQDPGLAGRRV